MALSGSTNFSLNGDQIIQEAFSLLGSYQTGVPVDIAQLTDSRIKLNLVLKTLQNRGFILQTRKKLTITPAAQISYTIALSGANVTNSVPLQIIQGFLRHNTTTEEIFLSPLNHEQYFSLLSRNNSGNVGQPTQYFYERTTYNLATLYLDRTPNADTISNYKIDLWYTKPIDDVDSSIDDIEIPVEGYEAVIWALAARLALPHGISIREADYIKQRAEQEFFNWLGLDRETPLKLEPDMSMYRRS